MTLDFQTKFTADDKGRQNDWVDMVLSRINTIHDQPAEEAVYHHSCDRNFRVGKNFSQFIKMMGHQVRDENKNDQKVSHS